VRIFFVKDPMETNFLAVSANQAGETTEGQEIVPGETTNFFAAYLLTSRAARLGLALGPYRTIGRRQKLDRVRASSHLTCSCFLGKAKRRLKKTHYSAGRPGLMEI
jgi:hypothetical protein